MATLLAAAKGQAILTPADGTSYGVVLHPLTTTTAEVSVLPPLGRLAEP